MDFFRRDLIIKLLSLLTLWPIPALSETPALPPSKMLIGKLESDCKGSVRLDSDASEEELKDDAFGGGICFGYVQGVADSVQEGNAHLVCAASNAVSRVVSRLSNGELTDQDRRQGAQQVVRKWFIDACSKPQR